MAGRSPHYRITAPVLLVAPLLVLSACATPHRAAGGKAGYPLVGFRVAARNIAGVGGAPAGLVEVDASHRSRHHRIAAIALAGPDGRLLKSVTRRKERVAPSGSRIVGRPGIGFGIGTGGIGIGFGAPFNFDAFLDSVLFSERSPWRWRTVAVFRIPAGTALPRDPARWRVRITLTDRKGRMVTLVRPLVLRRFR